MTYSEKLKKNLSGILNDVPVTKSTLNRDGQVILTFPSPDACNQAKSSLQPKFSVTNSDRKQSVIQPRLKIINLDPKLTQLGKTELRKEILTKNLSLRHLNLM